MKVWIWRLLLVAAILAGGVWCWHRLFPGPEQTIRKSLAEMARSACVTPNEAPMTRLSDTLKIASMFASDAEVVVDIPGQSMQTISGKESIRDAVGGARNLITSLKVQFVDIDVTLAKDRKSAVVRLTAKADAPGDSSPTVQELKMDFRNIQGDWLIQRAETVKTLR